MQSPSSIFKNPLIAFLPPLLPFFLFRKIPFFVAAVPNIVLHIEFENLSSLAFGAFPDTCNHRFMNGNISQVAAAHLGCLADLEY